MTDAATRLEKIVKETPKKMNLFSEAKSAERKLMGQWSKKEELGHLIDSASNNHQRFVRLQIDNDLQLLQYKQDEWVEVQHYQERKWIELIELWLIYNKHILHIIKTVDILKLRNEGHFPEYGTQTLQFMIDDYVDHIEHHLKRILEK